MREMLAVCHMHWLAADPPTAPSPRIELEEQCRARDVAELRMLIEQSVRGRRWEEGGTRLPGF